MPRIALVTGSDSNYYPLLREWIHSVRRFPESAQMDICVLDAGLTGSHKTELSGLVQAVVSPQWPKEIPAKKVEGKEQLKSCVCRPFIREIFPGYDIYMWMDADTWVQNWSGIQMFIDAALSKPESLIITNEEDRAYDAGIKLKWLWRWPWRIGSFYYSNAKKAFDYKTAKALLQRSVMSAGCFALSAHAPHWQRWQELVASAAAKGKLFTAEQLCLGVIVYLEGYKAEFLPSYTHWLCSRPLKWDAVNKQFVEPYIPNEPISLLHLTAVDALRASHKATKTFETTDGQTVEMSLRYPHLDAGDLITKKPKRG